MSGEMVRARWRGTLSLVAAALLLAFPPGAASGPAAPQEAPAALRTVLDGVFSRSQASRGETRFEQMCGSCHRTNEFSSVVFRRSWSGDTVRELFEVIATTMPEATPGSLRPEEYVDIVAFILASNDYPAGEEDLPTDLFELGNINIVERPE